MSKTAAKEAAIVVRRRLIIAEVEERGINNTPGNREMARMFDATPGQIARDVDALLRTQRLYRLRFGPHERVLYTRQMASQVTKDMLDKAKAWEYRGDRGTRRRLTDAERTSIRHAQALTNIIDYVTEPLLAVMEDGGCRFPIGDPRKPGFHYCAKPRARHTDYCEECLQKMYRTQPTRKDANHG